MVPSNNYNSNIKGQFSSVAQPCLSLCDHMDCSTPGFPVHQQLPEIAQTHVPRVGDAIQPSHPLSSPSPPPFNFSQHQGFSNESVLHFRWLKNWSFSFSISPSSEYSGLIFFMMDWLDLLAVQGTLKTLQQHHNSKASFLQCSAFFYGPTLISIHDYWRNRSFDLTDLCWQSNVSAFFFFLSLLFSMLSRLTTAFLPRTKLLLIS